MSKKLTEDKREALKEEAKKIIEWGRTNNFPLQPKKKSGKKAK